jgi:hypothetical protein
MSTQEAEDLRRDLRRHGRARGKRFAPQLRQRIVAYAERRRREGTSWMAIATELDACFETIRRWCGGGSVAAARQLRRVEVTAEPAVAVSAPTPLAVVTPNGLRIEGVGLDDVITLVRALG